MVAPKVGDCYNLSAKQVDQSALAIKPVDCARKHTAEIIALTEWPSATSPYAMTAKKRMLVAADWCQSALDTLREPTLNYWAYYVPTKAQWEAGERTLRCDGMQTVYSQEGDKFTPWKGSIVVAATAPDPGIRVTTKSVNTANQCWEAFNYPVFSAIKSKGAVPASVVTLLNADVQRAIASVPKHDDSSCDADFRGLLAVQATVNWRANGVLVVVFTGYAMETGSAHGSHMQWTSAYTVPDGLPIDLLGEIGFTGLDKLRDLASQAVIDKYGDDALIDEFNQVPGIFDDPQTAFKTWAIDSRGLRLQFDDCLVTSCGIEPAAYVVIPWADASAALYNSRLFAKQVLPSVWN